MATVKLQNGKVILKNGKVSCICCEEEECCMYPADRLFPFSTDPDFFTFDDLPDELEYNGSIWPKTIELFSGGGTSACWKLYQSPDDEEDMILWNVDENEYGTLGCADGDGPNYTRQQSLGIVCCLIDLDFQDQFADTYTINVEIFGSGPQTIQVERESLCVWSGFDNCNRRVFLEITLFDEDIPEETFYSWAFTYFGIECPPLGGNARTAYKSAFQNTPVGDYYVGPNAAGEFVGSVS
jgi:hypothetical protein